MTGKPKKAKGRKVEECPALPGARGQPALNVGPGALVSSASRHDSDVTSRRAEEFFVLAADLRQDRRRLTGRSDVITLGDDRQKVCRDAAQVDTFSPNHPLVAHQTIVAVEVDHQLP